MTDKELQTLCAEYSNSRPIDEMPCNPGFARMIAADFYRWLSSRYCLVEKSKIVEEYHFWKDRLPKTLNLVKEVQNIPDTARMFGKIEILIELFGKEFFNEEK